MRNKQKGFSLIELLIVVAIILIIAAIAIPNLLRSRMAANEASAVASLRTINTAQVVYSSTYNVGFAAALTNLADNGALANCTPPAVPTSAQACLIDGSLSGATTTAKSGYLLTYTQVGATGGVTPAYTLTNQPQALNSTGIRYFFTNETNVIRQKSGAAATATDSAI